MGLAMAAGAFGLGANMLLEPGAKADLGRGASDSIGVAELPGASSSTTEGVGVGVGVGRGLAVRAAAVVADVVEVELRGLS